MGGRWTGSFSLFASAAIALTLAATTSCKKDLPRWMTDPPDSGDEWPIEDDGGPVDPGDRDPGVDEGKPDIPGPGDATPDTQSDVPSSGPLAVRIQEPAPGQAVSGTVEIRVEVTSPSTSSWDLSIAFVGAAAAPTTRGGSGPSAATVPVNTRSLVDGDWKIRATVRDSGGHEALAEVPVKVDNTPPEVAVQVKVEGDGGVVSGRIELVLRAKDLQSGIATASLSADGAVVKTWTAELADETFVLDAGTWAPGPHTIILEALDKAANGSRADRLVQVVPPPTIAGFPERKNTQWDDPLTGGAGLRLGPAEEGRWGLMVAGTRNLYLVEQWVPALVLVPVFEESPCENLQVADIDLDGMDDVVAWCRDRKAFLVLLQRQGAERPGFLQVEVPGPRDKEQDLAVRDFALGDISRDGFPDIVAVVVEHQQPVVLYRSSPISGGAAFRDPERFAGGFEPTLVAVGDLADNGRNAIAIATADVPTLTVFPVTVDGIVLQGENSFIGDLDDTGNPVKVDYRDMLPILHRPRAGVTGPHRLFITSREAGREAPYLRSLAAVPANQSFTITRKFDATSGRGPSRIAEGDVDGNGVVDAALLDTGSRILQVWRFVTTAGTGADAALAMGHPDSFAVGNAVDVTMADLDNDSLKEPVLIYADRLVAAAWGPGTVPLTANGGARCAWMDLPGAPPIPGSLPIALPATCPIGPSAVGRFVPMSPPRADRGMDLVTFPPKVFSKVYPQDPEWGVPGRDAVGSACEQTHPQNVNSVFAGDLTPGLPAQHPLDDLLSMNLACDARNRNEVTLGIDYNESYVLPGEAPRTLGIGHTQLCRPTLATMGQFDTGRGVASPEGEIAVFSESESPSMSVFPLIVLPDQAPSSEIPVSKAKLPIRKIVASSMRRSLAEVAFGGPFETDLVMLNGGTQDFAVFIAQGDLTLSQEGASKNFSVGRPPVDLVTGYLDVPVDGSATPEQAAAHLPDVVVLSTQGLHVSFSLDNVDEVAGDSKALEFLPPWYVEYPKLPRSTPALHRVALADVNGDGYLDILVLDRNRSELAVYLNLSDRTFALVGRYAVGTDPVDLLPGDLDGDGRMDMTTVDQIGQTFTFVKTLPATATH